MRRALVVPLILVGFAVACDKLAHVSDYAVAPPVVPYSGLCNACPPDPGLAYAPCPADNDAPTQGQGSTYVYAFRHVALGADPSQLADPGFDIGLDEDCSARADGLPAWCLPLPVDGGLGLTPESNIIPSPPWAPLPRGIDNALSLRVLGPIVAFAGITGVDDTLSQTFEAGQYGELVIVDDYNGLPNDNGVKIRFVGSSGTVTQPPKWDGNDVWIPNAATGAASYTKFDGYVVDGVLVADTRSVGEDDSNISVSGPDGGVVTFTLAGRYMVRVAQITPTSMSMILSGRWNVYDALTQAPVLATFLAGGDPLQTSLLDLALPGLLEGAADMPLGEQATPGVYCGAISFGVKAEAFPAKVQGGT